MDVVLTYVNDVNRPVNATNVGDALGARGVKKGLAQKYLDALVERGKIALRDAGKQKVYHALQDGEVLDADALREMRSRTRVVMEEVGGLNENVRGLKSTLRALRSVQSVEEMETARRALEKENAALEERLAPLRLAKKKGEVITESERVKIEDAFLKSMETWLDRRRKFNNLFETVLEGTGLQKKKLWDDLGAESEEDHGIDYAKFRKIYDDIKKQRQADARAKRMKRFHVTA
jgi:26S proteasome regulatory subunit (ATPase 3-interacting protein)|tara:strand:+ start:11499 stop:12200 length:702 start_codon:yes stop_codon:yes gene_type:complete